MTEWLESENLEDPESTTQDLLNELANESDEIAGKVEFWPVSTDAGYVRNNGERLINRINQD